MPKQNLNITASGKKKTINMNINILPNWIGGGGLKPLSPFGG